MKTKKMFANDGREVTDGVEVRWIGDAGEPQFWRIRTVECAFDGFVDLEGGITVPISEIDSVLTKEELIEISSEFDSTYSAFCD